MYAIYAYNTQYGGEATLKLSEHRKKKGLTQTELGVMLEVSQQQVAKYEAGTSIPSKVVIYKMMEALDLSPHEVWEMFYGDLAVEKEGGSENA